MRSVKSSKSHDAPRYDHGLNPPYQINYRAKRAGKHITATKRRITFQFGFSSAKAVSAGLREVDFRGEEHEVVLIWSHVSGKRHVYMDGREVHMSKAARGNTKFEYSWSIPGNHVLKILANGTPPMGEAARAHHRQFDLELDGLSFFDFCKIYELGNLGSSSSAAPAAPASGYSYRGIAYDARDDDYDDEDEVPVPEVKVASVVDFFDAGSAPQSMISPVTQFSSMPSLASSSSMTSYDEFAPVESSQSYQRSFDAISSDIMCAYGKAAPAPPAAGPAPTSCRALVPLSEEGMDVVAKSMKNLVNLDDITTKPLQPIAPNSPSLGRKNVSNGGGWGLVGRAPTLSELQQSPMKAQQQQQYSQAQAQGQHYYQQQNQAPSYGYQYGTAPANNNMGYAPNMGYATNMYAGAY